VIDTHAHLDACAESPEVVVGRARDAGIDRILTVATTVDGARDALELAERYEGVWAILGVHPHASGADDAERLDELRELLAHPKAVAVGETGLDFYRDYAPHDRQLDVFERELALSS
jgi:TatD DNase family protein